MFKQQKLVLNTRSIKQVLKDRGYSQYDVAATYITGFKGIGTKIRSDLRTDDKNDSLNTKIGASGDVIVSDFGYRVGMTVFQYVGEKYYGASSTDYIKGLDKIRNDFGLDELLKPQVANKLLSSIRSLPKQHGENMTISSPTVIEVKAQRIEGRLYWTPEDILYWNSYGVSIEKLTEKDVIPLETVWLTKAGKGRMEYDTRKKLAYAYPFQKNEFGDRMYKIYMPYADVKWISSASRQCIQNIHALPKEGGELLIIQTSYKDIMCMEELNPTLHILATNGEGMWFEPKAWKYLKSKWKNIVLFGNNDSHKVSNPGLRLARRHSLKYKIPFVMLPDNTASDISDYRKKYGYHAAKHILDKTMSSISNYLLVS